MKLARTYLNRFREISSKIAEAAKHLLPSCKLGLFGSLIDEEFSDVLI
ncbi:MAG: hypothetical protein QXX95_03580 [Nitrososphaerales archaeon]